MLPDFTDKSLNTFCIPKTDWWGHILKSIMLTVTVNSPSSSLVIYHTHLANKELQMISSCLNWSCELQPYLPKSLVFMLDTCKMWAGRKKAMALQCTTDKYVDQSMVPREHKPHPELEGVILSSRPGRCISMPLVVLMCKFQKLSNHGKLAGKIVSENKVK